MSAFNYYMAASDSQTPAASTNENNRTAQSPTPISNSTAANHSIATNSNKQKKRYYCSYGNHGHNNSHNTKDCQLRKRIHDDYTHPAHPTQKILRQAITRVVKKQMSVDKKEEGQLNHKYMEKGLAAMSNKELKDGMEELGRKMQELGQKMGELGNEMRRRGVR